MKLSHTWRAVCCACALSAALAYTALAHAAPGAHGPDGEHLDAPGASLQAGHGAGVPRLETQTEAFELVARLHAHELSLYVNHFASNEPVLAATLEVELGSLRAPATFRPEAGDYVLTDAALLAALQQPGEHALVFTLLAGEQADLLEGRLQVDARASEAGGHGHGHGLLAELQHLNRWALGAGAGLAGLGLGLGLGALRWRRARPLPRPST